MKIKIINCDLTDKDDNSLVNVFWDADYENKNLQVEVERQMIRNED